jgi:uncharacterized protein YcgI (DUF1989 family)
VALLLGHRPRRGRGHQRLQARHVVDVGGDGDVVATRCSSKTNYTAPTSLVKSKEE